MCAFLAKKTQKLPFYPLTELWLVKTRMTVKRSFFNSVNEKLRFGSGIIQMALTEPKNDHFTDKLGRFWVLLTPKAYGNSLHDPGPKSKFFVNKIKK